MKTRDTKRQPPTINLYCAYCSVRVGIGERHLVRDGKKYHYGCYPKQPQGQRK